MRLKLKFKTNKGDEILEREPLIMVDYRERRSLFGTEIDRYEWYDSTEFVYLKKVADQPYELIELMKDCIAGDKKPTDSIVRKVLEPKDSLPSIVKIITPEKPPRSLPPVTVPVEKKTENINVPKTLAQRKNKEQKSIVVDVKTINLKVYDNAIMDGDTVSILYNGKMLLTHQLLSEKGIELNIELDENLTRHEITLFAENLGSIPPNTALIVITAGKKRYELFASASLEENAVLVFEYKPK